MKIIQQIDRMGIEFDAFLQALGCVRFKPLCVRGGNDLCGRIVKRRHYRFIPTDRLIAEIEPGQVENGKRLFLMHWYGNPATNSKIAASLESFFDCEVSVRCASDQDRQYRPEVF